MSKEAAIDIIAVYEGLARDHGPDAMWMNPTTSTCAVSLIDTDGSPLYVGWFNNSASSNPISRRDNYATISWPEEQRNKNHCIMTQQLPGGTTAEVIEEDSAGYLEGYDSWPNLIRRQQLTQVELNQQVRSTLLGAHIVTLGAGEGQKKLVRSYDHTIADVRASGLAIVEAGTDVLGVITAAELEKYAGYI